MIDKYRLDDLRLESGEKGELARWVIQLQTYLDRERRKVGNYPVIPDGYVMVPMRLTAENGAKAALLGEFNLEYSLTCHECFGEGCDDCSGEGHGQTLSRLIGQLSKQYGLKALSISQPPRRR